MTAGTAEFVLTAPPQPIGPEHQLVIGLMITNHGDREQYFNTRFAVVPFAGDVWPVLTGPNGHAVPFALRVRLAPLRNSDFLLLKPNESVVAGASLRRLFALNEHGTYTLSAKYVSKSVPRELESLPVFIGEIAAKPIQFTI